MKARLLITLLVSLVLLNGRLSEAGAWGEPQPSSSALWDVGAAVLMNPEYRPPMIGPASGTASLPPFRTSAPSPPVGITPAP